MFEEVPAERRGMARLLSGRRVVLGPFVLGGGVLLAAVGGSVAVAAAAATMITASTIGSDVPPRPGYPASSASSSQHTLAAHRPPARHPAATADAPTAAGPATVAHPSWPSAPGAGPSRSGAPSATGAAPAVPAPTAASRPPARSATPTPTTSTPAGSPSPSSSAPVGNATIHVSGYDQASQRLVYQFAAVQAGGYRITDPTTYAAVLAPSLTITSGGGICPPAGSACTRDQLIGAADSGFFAVAAIDAQGQLRSLIEVAEQSAAPKLAPAPSTSPNARGSHPAGASPTPTGTPSAGS